MEYPFKFWLKLENAIEKHSRTSGEGQNAWSGWVTQTGMVILSRGLLGLMADVHRPVFSG